MSVEEEAKAARLAKAAKAARAKAARAAKAKAAKAAKLAAEPAVETPAEPAEPVGFLTRDLIGQQLKNGTSVADITVLLSLTLMAGKPKTECREAINTYMVAHGIEAKSSGTSMASRLDDLIFSEENPEALTNKAIEELALNVGMTKASAKYYVRTYQLAFTIAKKINKGLQD